MHGETGSTDLAGRSGLAVHLAPTRRPVRPPRAVSGAQNGRLDAYRGPVRPPGGREVHGDQITAWGREEPAYITPWLHRLSAKSCTTGFTPRLQQDLAPGTTAGELLLSSDAAFRAARGTARVQCDHRGLEQAPWTGERDRDRDRVSRVGALAVLPLPPHLPTVAYTKT